MLLNKLKKYVNDIKDFTSFFSWDNKNCIMDLEEVEDKQDEIQKLNEAIAQKNKKINEMDKVNETIKIFEDENKNINEITNKTLK